MDYLYILNGYLLVLRDDLSSKIDLVYADSPTADIMASAIISWRGRYGLPSDALLVTDQGSLFANQLLEHLQHKLHYRHHFTVAYSPWANGSAEVTNRLVLKLFTAIMSEAGPEFELLDWPQFIPQVVMYLNESPRRSLTLNGKMRCPNHIYFAMDDTPDPIDPFVWKKVGRNWRCRSLDSAELKVLFHELQTHFDRMHAPIADLKQHLRTVERERLNRRSGLHDISFQLGDLVLVSHHATSTRRSKIQLTWTGPYLVTHQINEHVYRVQPLKGESMECHVQRLKLYDSVSSALDVEEVHAQFVFNTGRFEVSKFIGLRYNRSQSYYETLISWRGLDEIHNSWEPVQQIFHDVPELFLDFLRTKRTKIAQRLLKSLSPES